MIKALTFRDKYYFDWKEARRVIKFFQTELKHVKGEMAGQTLRLERWQRRILKRAFGWRARETGARKYKIVWLELPRKNGKSFIASGVSLFLTFADKEPGAEIVSAAGDTEQAAIVFETAKQIMDANPKLSSLGRSYKRTIVVPSTFTSYKVLSAEAYSKHGKNLHGIIVDEVHVQPNADLIDTLLTSRGSRRQPLCFMCTTAGHSRNTVCWDYHDYAVKVRDGFIDDPSFLSCIFAADPEDDWTAEETWKKANPNYGVSIRPDFLREECEKAKASPRYENTFKRLYLNLWTQQETRWLALEKWDACAVPEILVTRETLCYAGLDLSTNLDITALALVFQKEEGKIAVKMKFYIPEENVAERVKKDRVPYDHWIKEGHLVTTPGNVVDYDFIEADFLALQNEYNIREVAIDPWNAVHLSTKLQGHGVAVAHVRQGFSSLSGPSKDLEARVIGKRIEHDGDPILRWMVGNVAIETDAAGNIKPSKKRSPERVDGVFAKVMALSRLIVNNQGASVYESRGVLTLG